MPTFNSALIPRPWIRQILEEEHDDVRFERFANDVVSILEGKPVVGTSKSWDLGRDGRSIGTSNGVYVLATLRGDAEKARTDAERLKAAGAKAKRVYFVSSQALSEHTLRGHAATIGQVLGPQVEVEPLALTQIEDLVATGKVAEAFKKTYGGEIGGIRTVMEALGEQDASLHQLEFALATFGATNTQELRAELGSRLILTLLSSSERDIEALARAAGELLGVEAFSASTLQYYLAEVCGQQLIEKTTSGQYRLTEGGRAALEQSRAAVVASELKGRGAIRAAIEESLGAGIADAQWSAL